jgi:hypothetical protein
MRVDCAAISNSQPLINNIWYLTIRALLMQYHEAKEVTSHVAYLCPLSMM